MTASIDYISQPLSSIINCSFTEGTFPNDLKAALVTPLHKGGDRSCLTNYRPVSILISISKYFEEIFLSHLSSFLVDNNLLRSHQYGFCTGYSTYEAL